MLLNPTSEESTVFRIKDSDEPETGYGAGLWIPAFAGMTKSGDWYGELAGWIPPLRPERGRAPRLA